MVQPATGIYGDYTDFFAGGGAVFGPGFRNVKPPSVFYVTFSLDTNGAADELQFHVGDPATVGIRRVKSSYRIYFTPIDQASPTAMGNKFTRLSVFRTATMIASADAPENGGVVSIANKTHVGLDGWFWATAVNLLGIESDPATPFRNPVAGTNDKRVPADPLEVTADKFDGGLDPWGRQLVRIATTCKVPPQSNGVSLVTMENPGTDYTHDFPVIFTTADGDTTGHGAYGVAVVRDGGVEGVTVTQAGEDYTLPPVVQFDNGDGIGAQARSTLTVTGSFSAYQIYLFNYFLNGDVVEGPTFTAPTFGLKGVNYGTLAHGDFLLYPDSPPVHPVRLHFVSLSQTGTRRPDPQGAPFVEFSTGILL